MTPHVLNRRELLGATAAVGGLSLGGALACDGRESVVDGETVSFARLRSRGLAAIR
jgi:hypothetical protein